LHEDVRDELERAGGIRCRGCGSTGTATCEESDVVTRVIALVCHQTGGTLPRDETELAPKDL